MPPARIKIYLYIQTPRLGGILARLLLKEGFEPVLLDHRLGVDPTRNLVLVETGSDAAHLSQVVSYFYHTHKTESTLPILAFVPQKTLKLNPMLSCWLIDGRPALSQIIPLKRHQLRKRHRRAFLWFLCRFLPLYPCVESPTGKAHLPLPHKNGRTVRKIGVK